jgi:hypothetical protein
MSSAPYQALPSDDYDEERSPIRQRHIPEHHQLVQDPRFNPPPPAWWKRALVILVIVLLFWLYFSLRASMQRGAEPDVIHAHRCVRSAFLLLILFVFQWSGALIFLYRKDTQRNTSTVPRRALSLPRNSRTVGYAYGAHRLIFDLCKLSYYDRFRDHGQLPR